ncbi:MAG: hypothetical protein IT439_04245 [Phycisphaerales bacterium]|nr:hypothetical protein [Phycisphaerales bacterium]
MSRLSKVLVVCGGCASLAQAQVIDWAAAVSGNWSNIANWSPMDVPNTAAETARFQINGTYTATVDGTFSIGSLQQTISNVTISIPGGANLFVNGPTYNNRGLVVINPANVGAETRVRFDANTTITGNGTTRLAGIVNRSIVDSLAGVTTVTNGPNHTFDGFGQFRSVLTNNGTVDANSSGNVLSLLSNGKTNNALFRASAGGVLSIDSIGIAQGAAGFIRSDGGTVQFTGTGSVTGGTVEGVLPSVVTMAGTTTFTDVTTAGRVNVNGGDSIRVSGAGLTNIGEIHINPSNVGVETRVRFDAPGALAGAGSVVLDGIANRAILESIDANAVITVGASQTVRGMGQVRAALVNNGLVSADNVDSPLDLLVLPKTNNSLMRAVGGAVLDIRVPVAQSIGGSILADAGTVRLHSGASIAGGELDTANAGLVQVANSMIPFSGVRNEGMVDVNGGTGIAASSTLENNGLITINPGNVGAETRLRFDDSSSLSGTGLVVMNGLENRAILETAAGAVMTIGSAQTVEGQGQVRAELINNGEIVANLDMLRLRLVSTNKTNNALMRAENNARLTLSGIGVSQGPAGVIEAADAVVELESASITNGTLRSVGTGVVNSTNGSNTLRDVSFSGVMNVQGGTGVLITGTGLVNTGLITINPTDAGVETRIRFDESGALSGAGEVRLTAFNNRAILETNTGVTLTNSAPHLISGRGELRAALINNSTVRANLPASSLNLIQNPKTNNSVFEVTDGGQMSISGIAVTQGPGGVIRNLNGSLSISSSSVTGGDVIAAAGFVVVHGGTNTLTDVDTGGTHNVNGGSSLVLNSSLTNDGLISINPTNAGVETRLRVDTATSIDGTGEIRLSGSANRSILECVAPATLGPGQTLTGIGQTRGSYSVSGTIAPGFSAGSIDVINGTVSLTETAALEIEIGGTSSALFDNCTGNATWNLNGALEVSQINGFVPALGQRYVIITASAVAGTFDTLIAPDLGGIEWKVVYFPNKVELQVRCKADLSGSSDPNDPSYGIPDGVTDASDFFYYLDLFVSSDSRADLTTSSDPNDPSYGIKDGIIDASDFFFFLDLFTGACG